MRAMRDRRRRQLSWQSPVPLALVSLTSSRLGEEARARLPPASSEPVGHHVTVAPDVDLQAKKGGCGCFGFLANGHLAAGGYATAHNPYPFGVLPWLTASSWPLSEVRPFSRTVQNGK